MKEYSILYTELEFLTRTCFVKFLQFLVKANGVNVQTPGWEKSQEKIENVVRIALELSQGLKFSYMYCLLIAHQLGKKLV